jgi:hypothetical protein
MRSPAIAQEWRGEKMAEKLEFAIRDLLINVSSQACGDPSRPLPCGASPGYICADSRVLNQMSDSELEKVKADMKAAIKKIEQEEKNRRNPPKTPSQEPPPDPPGREVFVAFVVRKPSAPSQ